MFFSWKFFEKFGYKWRNSFAILEGILLVFILYTKFGEDNPISQTLYYLNNVVNPLNSFFSINGVKMGIQFLFLYFYLK